MFTRSVKFIWEPGLRFPDQYTSDSIASRPHLYTHKSCLRPRKAEPEGNRYPTVTPSLNGDSVHLKTYPAHLKHVFSDHFCTTPRPPRLTSFVVFTSASFVKKWKIIELSDKSRYTYPICFHQFLKESSQGAGLIIPMEETTISIIWVGTWSYWMITKATWYLTAQLSVHNYKNIGHLWSLAHPRVESLHFGFRVREKKHRRHRISP